jgi:hypothetical protein
MKASAQHEKIVWVQTSNKQVLTAAIESGFDTFLFASDHATLQQEWAQLARFSALFYAADGSLRDAAGGDIVGRVFLLETAEDLKAAEAAADSSSGFVIMDAQVYRAWHFCLDVKPLRAMPIAGHPSQTPLHALPCPEGLANHPSREPGCGFPVEACDAAGSHNHQHR